MVAQTRSTLIDLRPALLVVGLLLSTLGSAMMLPAMVDFGAEEEDWSVFLAAALVTFFVGISLWASTRSAAPEMGLRQAFLMTTLSWLALAAFGSLPFMFSRLELSPADAFFETMSGLTTTGATVIIGLDHAPPGLLLWRSILQWLGGLGVIVMALAVLPMLQIGGMQIFRAQAFETAEKILPRAASIAGVLTLVFVGLTVACAAAYSIAGMTTFDAINHAMTTVATGGFSTRDASIGHYDSVAIDWVATVFMASGALPFLLYIKMLRGHWSALITDIQVRVFFALISAFTVIVWLQQHLIEHATGLTALRYAAFNVTSIMTGTGYATQDYGGWGPAMVGLFFVITFIGGCAGSTSCGVKIFRIVILFQDLRQHLQRILHPHGIFVRHFNGRPIPDDVSAAVLSFFFLFFLTFALVASALSLMGLDALTAISASATAIANVGPGLGEIVGPSGNFAALPDPAKWLLSFAMLAGRLELFTVLVLFLPSFWRN